METSLIFFFLLACASLAYALWMLFRYIGLKKKYNELVKKYNELIKT